MNKENNLKNNPRITESLPILSHYGFLPKKLIGIGKDAVSFVAKKENDLFVVKVLSDYAKKFLPITKDVLSKCKSNTYSHSLFLKALAALNGKFKYLKGTKLNITSGLLKFNSSFLFSKKVKPLLVIKNLLENAWLKY